MTRLEAADLRSGYGTVPVLHGVSLAVSSGEIVAVVGRNGAGKTTLVKTVLGVLRATGGQLFLDGVDITRLPPSRRARAGLRATFQERALFGDLSVSDNLRLNGFGSESHDRVLSMFATALSGRGSQRAATLSGGEQKMLAAAIALATTAPLLVMDEPTEGLQPSNVALLGDHIESARGRRSGGAADRAALGAGQKARRPVHRSREGRSRRQRIRGRPRSRHPSRPASGDLRRKAEHP